VAPWLCASVSERADSGAASRGRSGLIGDWPSGAAGYAEAEGQRSYNPCWTMGAVLLLLFVVYVALNVRYLRVA